MKSIYEHFGDYSNRTLTLDYIAYEFRRAF